MENLHPCLEQIERATEILNLLEWEMRQGRFAASQLNRESMQQHTEIAGALADRFACLLKDSAAQDAMQTGSKQRSCRIEDERLCEAQRELRDAAEHLAKSATDYMALLRRSRRTVNVLMNVIATTSGAYFVPGATRSLTSHLES